MRVTVLGEEFQKTNESIYIFEICDEIENELVVISHRLLYRIQIELCFRVIVLLL